MPVTPIDVECQLFSGWRAAYICRLRRWHRPMLQSIYVAICHDSTEDALPRRRRRQRIVDQSHGLAYGQCQIPRHGGAHLRRDEPQGGLRLQRSKSLFVGHQRHPQGIFFLFFFLILLRLSWVNHSPSHLFIWLFSFSLKLFHFFLIKMYIIGWQIAFVFVSRCVHLGRRIVPLFQRRHEGRSAHWLVRDLLE